jgi:heptaprenyl diphosphate synthase
MMSPLQQSEFPQSNKMMAMAIMVALGVILHRLEALLPLPSPWIKLGLANLMTLVALVFLGFKEAVIVTFLRVVLGSILGGTFLGPTFFLSLVGGIAAILIMGILYKAGKNYMSLIGISIFGAYTHTLTTSLCVYYFLIRESSFFTLLPFFFSLALLTGILTGSIANTLSRQMQGISFNLEKLQ